MITLQQRWFLLASTGILLLSITPPTAAEVMDSILNNDCTTFFLNEAPPQVPGILMKGQIQDQSQYKPICQTYENERRFVTLYDTKNRIPVFSAYKFRGITGNGGARRRWMIEPQLEDRNTNNMRVDRYDHQAGNKDYTNTGRDYNRGHLYPSFHGFSKNDKESTCALTNIVPQAISFNGGSWNKMETCVQCVLHNYCKNNNNAVEAFVIVGAQPSANNKLNNRVNIPEVLWTAFCCYSSRVNRWLASAHWGANVRETAGSKYMQTKTLAELEQQLSINGSPFEGFPGSSCPQHETVTEFYPEINANDKKCQCPEKATTTSAPTTTNPSTTSVSTLSTTLLTTEETATTISPTTTPSVATTTTTTATTSTTTSTTTTTTRTTTKKQDDSKKKEKHEQGENQGRPDRGGGVNAGGVVSGVLQGIGSAITGIIGAVGAVAGGAGGAVAGGAGGAVAGGAGGAVAAGAGGAGAAGVGGGSVGGAPVGAGGAGAGGGGGGVGGAPVGAAGAGAGGGGGSVGGVSVGGGGAGAGGGGGSVGGVSVGGGGAGAGGGGSSVGGVSVGAGGAGAGGSSVGTGEVVLGVGGTIIGGAAVVGGVVGGIMGSQKNHTVTSKTPTKASDPFVPSDFNASAKDGINPTVTFPTHTNEPSIRLTSAAMTSATASIKDTPMTIFPLTNKPRSNTTDERSTTTNPTATDPPVNMTNQMPTTTNPTSDPPFNMTKQMPTTTNPTSDPPFNMTKQMPTTTNPTSDPPFNMTKQMPTTTNPTITDPPSTTTKWTFSAYIQHFLNHIVKKPVTHLKHSFEQLLNHHLNPSGIPLTTEPTFSKTNKASTTTMPTTFDPLQQQPFSYKPQALAHLLSARQRRPPRRFQRPRYHSRSQYSKYQRPFLHPTASKRKHDFAGHPINLDIPH